MRERDRARDSAREDESVQEREDECERGGREDERVCQREDEIVQEGV